MAELIEMTQLSPTMEEGVVVAWLVKEGDTVAAGDLIAEIETDKATMEMESYFDGTVLRILAPAGTSAPVGTLLAIIGEPDEDIDALLAKHSTGKGDEKETDETDDADETEVEDEEEVEEEPDVETEVEGDEKEQEVEDEPEDDEDELGVDDETGEDDEGDEPVEGAKHDDNTGAKAGTKPTSATKAEVAAKKSESAEPALKTAAAPKKAEAKKAEGAPKEGRVFASPLARKIAGDRGIDLAAVTGSGPQGRIVRRDVEAFEPSTEATEAKPTSDAKPSAAAKPSVGAPPSADATTPESTTVPLSQMRKAIARNLTAAWQAPSFGITREIAMDRAMAMRAEINDALDRDGAAFRVSVNDLIIKACALALIDVPEMNCAYEGDALTMYATADIGVAVALEGGLITPIVRQAETKSLSTIAAEVADLAARARKKKLKPHEFTGATFSISNLGMFGVDQFNAVLNPPAAGILAVSRTRKLPVVNDDDTIGVGLRMNVTLTCDHRAVDGVVGATFLKRFAAYMESPPLMFV